MKFSQKTKNGTNISSVKFSSVTQSCPTLYDPMDCSMLGFPVHHQLTPGTCSNSCPSGQWCHTTISSSVVPFSSFLQSFSASGSFQMSQLFASGDQSIGVSASASSFQWIFRTDFLYDCLVWSLCSPRDSQESSPTPQFKSTNSSSLSFLHSPTPTSIYDYWKNHGFD